MAQHPEKLKWKDAHPHGLSASQFGMALGFRGRISDYVHYLRHVVGTEHEFKGNEFTAHGISTEPKSRALYELLTGCQVHDGGFFVTEDRILGCSPDGQIFFPAEEKPIEQQGPLDVATTTKTNTQSIAALSSGDGLALDGQPQQQSSGSRCSVRIPFKSKVRVRSPLSGSTLASSAFSPSFNGNSSDGLQSCTAGDGFIGPLTAVRIFSARVGLPPTPSAGTGNAASSSSSFNSTTGKKRRTRLLEIKSPFRALYDCTKASYAPFGIPKHYMCQIQGQLAIADCEECDFFVYLDHPSCQVEAWRVRRSREFWQWAEPNLRQVSEWVKNGPPDWLNRSFAFSSFDFNRIDVIPLVFPYDITAGAALTDARRFPFFAKYPSPYEALKRHREARGRSSERFSSGDASVSLASQTQWCVQEWCRNYCGMSWTDLTEFERIALAVQTPAVRYLFETKDNNEEDPMNSQDGGKTMPTGENCDGGGRFCQTLSAWRRLLEFEGNYEGSATAKLWRSFLCTAFAGRDPLVELTVAIPEDWEEGVTTVQCTLPNFDQARDSTGAAFSDTVSLGFFQRLFLVSLTPAPAKNCVVEMPPSLASHCVLQRAYATPLDDVPIFLS